MSKRMLLALQPGDDARAHLIALTTHGRTGLIRAVIGSVAERVVRASDVSVLVVR